MRKFHQNKLLELTQTLYEATNELDRLIPVGDFDTVLQLLVDCQGFAVQMGEYIEAIDREGAQIVSLIEGYHDELYKVSVEIVDRTKKTNYVKRLRKMISDIEKSIKTELKQNKTEVVFFPYKASMWDSLESVWSAAMNDPQCDVFVVPIPYFEKGDSTSTGKMYCEHDLYPDYVPVVAWEDYNIVMHHPDVIYIHYPYDDMAQNSSVHSRFFTKNMREHCDLIVYIPYYVLMNSDIPEYNRYLPGIVNADYVFVQSEEMRQAYISLFNKYSITLGDNQDLKNPERKFVAMGSPKFDKVLSSKKEDFELPDCWKRLIFSENCTAKKVILFNTHMFTWINGGAQYFRKVQELFSVFIKRDDVIVWWRPHPNTELNFRTMRPSLLDEYYCTVEEYKNGGYGIYDDTPDLHRALAWSDAYYGDESSLVAMYQLINKPAMIQRVYYQVRFLYADDYEIVFAFNKTQGNTVFSYNLSTSDISVLTNDDLLAPFRYSKCLKYSECYYFSPYYSDSIISYNKNTNTVNTYGLPEKKMKSLENQEVRLSDVLFNDSSIYYTPSNYPGIVRQSIFSGKLDVLDDFIEKIESLGLNKTQQSMSFGDAVMMKDKIVFPVKEINVIVVFDLPTETSKIVQLNSVAEKNGCIASCCDNNRLWTLSTDQCAMFRWDIESEQCDVLTLFSEKPYSGDVTNMFSDIFFFEGYVYMIARDSSNSYKVNIESDEVTFAEELDFDTFSPGTNYIVSHATIGIEIYFVTSTNEWYKSKAGGGSPQKVEPELSDKTRAIISNTNSNLLCNSKRTVDEQPEYGINNLLDFLLNENQLMTAEPRIEYRNSGTQIYEYVKSRLSDLPENN